MLLIGGLDFGSECVVFYMFVEIEKSLIYMENIILTIFKHDLVRSFAMAYT